MTHIYVGVILNLRGQSGGKGLMMTVSKGLERLPPRLHGVSDRRFRCIVTSDTSLLTYPLPRYLYK